MASKNYLRDRFRQALSPTMRDWLQQGSERYFDTDAGGYVHRRHMEHRLGIARGAGRIIPKETQGMYTLPGTPYQYRVYASGARPGRKRHGYVQRGLKRVFAICPECGKEVEAGHLDQHAYAHVPRELIAEVKALLK